MTLLNIIEEKIASSGPIKLSEYMALALGHPEFGYYTTRDPFGAKGDFTTAPEISQMFGELIGLWCVDYWSKMGAPASFNLVELGPGSGRLMKDALRSGKLVPEFIAAANIHLIETSPVLRESQAQSLAPQSISWHDSLDTVPNEPMIMIANEFFDAMPIQQFVKQTDGWSERHVGLDAENKLGFVDLPCDQQTLREFCKAHLEAEPGEIVEVNKTSESIVHSISERIEQFGGAAVIIDYGPARSAIGDSLQAVKNQSYADPLEGPGNADLTAHVDFERLTEISSKAGCQIQGPTSQGRFLERLGIEARAAILQSSANEDQKQDITAAFKRLVSTDEMGTLFKVISITKSGFPAAEGFEAQ